MKGKGLGWYYGASVAAFVIAFFAVLHFAPSSASVSKVTETSLFSGVLANLHSPLGQTLMQVLVIVVAALGAGALFTRLGQPAVIGEMAVGLAFGPSVLGSLLPGVSEFLFPAQSLGSLSILSQVGILLFLFVIGMELDVRMLQTKAQSTLLVSHASIIVPFTLGLTAALWLYEPYGGKGASFIPFALFMGISMSITAFPVLARIIKERGLAGTELGNVAITCAAVNDVTAWTALPFIAALARAESVAGCLLTLALTVVIVFVVIYVMKPLLDRGVKRCADPANPPKSLTVVVFASVFACALATETAGIHALFGAFIAGVAMPRHDEFRAYLRLRIEYFSTLFLVPIFFAFTGLRTEIGLLSGATDWLVCLLLLTLAVVGKFGGSAMAARACGMSWRDSSALGALMNTRGLIELIALNLGLDLGVLSPKIFAMLVLMALVTTFMTGPVINMLGVGRMTSVEPDGVA
ncbi:MAG: cation:proton antiporter [Fimbriimonadaceae bacterium]